MGRFLLVVFIATCAYVGWGKLKPLAPLEALHPGPYVIVYGRDSCGFTQNMRRELEKAGIPHHYEIIDRQPARDQVFARMEASRLDVSRFQLPVVDVNAKLFVGPEPEAILAAYRRP
jgi:hypothetical protein